MTENIENENQCECLILREFAEERGFDLDVPDIPGTTDLIRCQNIGTINEDGHYLCPEDARTCGMIYVPDPENSLYYQKKKSKKKKSKKEKKKKSKKKSKSRKKKKRKKQQKMILGESDDEADDGEGPKVPVIDLGKAKKLDEEKNTK